MLCKNVFKANLKNVIYYTRKKYINNSKINSNLNYIVLNRLKYTCNSMCNKFSAQTLINFKALFILTIVINKKGQSIMGSVPFPPLPFILCKIVFYPTLDKLHHTIDYAIVRIGRFLFFFFHLLSMCSL